MGWDQTLIKIDEEGATFRSYVDGTIHHLTPERSVDIQRQLGADLIVGKLPHTGVFRIVKGVFQLFTMMRMLIITCDIFSPLFLFSIGRVHSL